jgi:hypothetical protein
MTLSSKEFGFSPRSHRKLWNDFAQGDYMIRSAVDKFTPHYVHMYGAW